MSELAVEMSGKNSDISEERVWFAVRVKANRERITAAAFRSQGYEELVPVCQRAKRFSGRTRIAELPLFPGYVFCRFDKIKRLPILMHPGVLHIVGTGKEPTPVDGSEIEAIRLIAESPFFAQPWPFVAVGEYVQVICGPLRGAHGIIVAVKNTCRLIASLTLLQRSIAVEVDREWIEPCNPARFTVC